VLTTVVVSSCSKTDANTKEIAGLEQRVARLEQQVQEITQSQAAKPEMQTADRRRQELHKEFDKRMARDRAKYTPKQLQDAEKLYQVANQKFGTPEATASLRKLIQEFPDLDRTGCAILYLAQNSKGDERAKHLQDCIDNYNDCFYGDGVQVGVFARFLLAQDCRNSGDREKAATLENEIRSNYPDAVDHGGSLLVNSLASNSK
jgi:hypothetical protein